MGPLHSSKTPKTAYKETKDQWFLWFKSRNLHSLAFIMKKIPTLPTLVALATMLLAGCATTAPQALPTNVTVTYQDSDKFTDARPSFGSTTDQGYLDSLSEHVRRTAGQYVKPDQKLDVTVTDIDLAGDFIPTRAGMDQVRIVKDIYRPRMTLTFKLTGADGKVIKEGPRTLTDSFFMSTVDTINRDEPLFYDKEMLSTWLRDEFKP